MSLDGCPSDAELLRMKAEREGRSRALPVRYGPSDRATSTNSGAASAAIYSASADSPLSPIRLRIPWSCLISDNRKYGVVKGKLIAQKPYRDAKKRIRALAVEVMQDRPPAACPLSLTARVWMPNKLAHDLTNWCKLVHDAIEGVVMTNDSWLHRVTWERAGVDVDAPRAELTISPIDQSL